jgi:hypothetical protein
LAQQRQRRRPFHKGTTIERSDRSGHVFLHLIPAKIAGVADADGTVQAQDIRITGSASVPALDNVRSAFGNDLTMAVQNKW